MQQARSLRRALVRTLGASSVAYPVARVLARSPLAPAQSPEVVRDLVLNAAPQQPLLLDTLTHQALAQVLQPAAAQLPLSSPGAAAAATAARGASCAAQEAGLAGTGQATGAGAASAGAGAGEEPVRPVARLLLRCLQRLHNM